MRRFFIFLLVAPAVLVGVIVAAMLAGGSGGAAKPQAPQELTMVIRAGASHDTPYNLAVRPDVPVRLTIVNAQHEAHTFTIQELGVNQIVPPAQPGVASRVVVTFTAPFGVFHWRCQACRDGETGDIYSVITKRGSRGYPPGGFHWTHAA